MALNSQNLAQLMRNYEDLQQKYLKEQQQMEALQKEKMQEAHKAIDLEAKLVRATAEMRALQEKTDQ